MAHPLGDSGLLHGGDRVATADDCDASLGCQAGQGVGNALNEWGEKESGISVRGWGPQPVGELGRVGDDFNMM